MKRGLLGILAAGMVATAANAGELSLRFAGGGTEINMMPGDTATVEVVLNMNRAQDWVSTSTFSFTTGLNARFDVGSLVDGAGPSGTPAARPGWVNQYIQDEGTATKYSVTGIRSAIPNWDLSASGGPGGSVAFNRTFFFGAADPEGVSGLAGQPTGNVPTVIMEFDIQKNDFQAGDTFIAFHVETPLPAIYDNVGGQWGPRFQFTSQLAGNQWLMNPFGASGTNSLTLAGNPGDANPLFATRRGQEILFPLVIHNVPEPGSLALLALGGLASLRRRR
jgi:hypothetical protein